MARKNPRRCRPARRRSRGQFGYETLEERMLLAVAPLPSDGQAAPTWAADPAVGPVIWNGFQTIAFRDSYLVQMPSAKVVDARGHVNYVSAPPAIAAGWSMQDVGFGFYAIATPGTSVQGVQAWASAVGAVSVEPNRALQKQATPNEPRLPTNTPNDVQYGQYLWGLNNTGDPIDANGNRLLKSLESTAAAGLGNQDDIYPRDRDADIDAPEAWYIQTGVRDVIVAVFDDGIDDSNPDLNANMWSRTKANNALVAEGRAPIPAFDPVANPLGVGLHGFNSAEWLNPMNYDVVSGRSVFYEGSPFAPFNDPKFVSTRPGDLRLQNAVVAPVDPTQDFNLFRDEYNWLGANDSHGTHVAGIIGAHGNNGGGVTGVNWAVSLYSANIFRYGDYDDRGRWISASQQNVTLDDPHDVAPAPNGSMAAFVDAASRVWNLKQNFNQNFVVANLSFNTYGDTPWPGPGPFLPDPNGTTLIQPPDNPPTNNPPESMLRALQILNDAGLVIVVSAGNGYDPEYLDGVGDRIGTEPYPYNDCWTYPAGFRPQYATDGTLLNAATGIPNMIVVTASDAQDNLPRFSNWGRGVDIAAPGENIWSTVPLSARQGQPGTPDRPLNNIPVQYDGHEAIGLPSDPPAPFGAPGDAWGVNDPKPGGPLPPSWTYTVPNDIPGIPATETSWFVGQPDISRPYTYRGVVRPIQESGAGSATGYAGAYASMSGTSMATAYVSGVAALMAAEFYRWTNAMPSAPYLKQGILTQSDVLGTTLRYVEAPVQDNPDPTNDPPYDFQFAPTNFGTKIPVYRSGMYETTGATTPVTTVVFGLSGWDDPDIVAKDDPEPRTHTIGGETFQAVDGTGIAIPVGLRVNAYKCVFWVRNNLPASVSFGPRPETAADRGESRLEGDTGLWSFLYSATFVAGTGVFSGQRLPLGPIQARAWTQSPINLSAAYVATPGVDYDAIPVATPRVFTIPVQPAGTTRYDIPEADLAVRVRGDLTAENNESFSINFRIDPNTESIWCKSRLITDTIIDDDPTDGKPVVQVVTTTLSIDEGNGGIRAPTQAFVTFRLVDRNNVERAAIRPVLVPYVIRAPEFPRTVAAASQAGTTVTMATAVPHGFVTGQSVTVSSVGAGYDGTWVVTVLNPTTFTYTALATGLAARTSGSVRSTDEASDGDDFLGSSLTVQIPAGQSRVRVPVYVVGDTKQEVNEKVQLVIGTPNLGVKKRGTSRSAIEIRDDDFVITPPPPGAPPTLALTSPLLPVVEGSPAVFGLTLSGPVPAGGTVVVVYNVLDGTAKAGQDYVRPAAPRSVTIGAGATTGSITVNTLTDRLVEPSENFSVQILGATLTRADGSKATVTVPGPATRTATIADANTPPPAPSVALLAGPLDPVSEGGTATFTVTLSTPVPVGFAVAVYYGVRSGTATLGSDMAGPASGSIVIPAGATIGTIAVATLADRVAEADETFAVQVTRAVMYRVGTTVTQSVTVPKDLLVWATIADVGMMSMSKLRVKTPVTA